MKTVGTFAEARTDRVGVVGLVPTMGSFHAGHLSLIERAREECDTVVVSLFVNSLQFDDPDDLARYPADLDRDADLASAVGADVLFAPSDAEMYPKDHVVSVSVAGMGDVLEGAHRGGHFTGVATVVAKLLGGLQPNRAYFGRKDAQQLAVVRRLTTDLSFPVKVVGCRTVRDSNGLALSSRNTYLSDSGRQRALALSSGLMAAAAAIEHGERDGRKLAALALIPMADDAGVEPEYAALASQSDVHVLDELAEPAFLAVAARVGTTRLIDNIHIDLVEGEFIVDRGVRLGSGEA